MDKMNNIYKELNLEISNSANNDSNAPAITTNNNTTNANIEQ